MSMCTLITVAPTEIDNVFPRVVGSQMSVSRCPPRGLKSSGSIIVVNISLQRQWGELKFQFSFKKLTFTVQR